jgi:cystathionine beta-lyase
VSFLEDNMNFAYDFISKNIKGIIPYKLEATYLMWLDCRNLGLSTEKIDELFFKDAKIALDSGHWFGDNGKGFMRLNLACSKEMLLEGLDRLKKAVENIDN